MARVNAVRFIYLAKCTMRKKTIIPCDFLRCSNLVERSFRHYCCLGIPAKHYTHSNLVPVKLSWTMYDHLNRFCHSDGGKSNLPASPVASSDLQLQATSEQNPNNPSESKIKVADSVLKVAGKKKRQESQKSSTDRNFITAMRAMNEYLLKPTDLEGLRKFYRRSPYDGEPPIAVFLRMDVESKAMEVWGSAAALQKELRKKQEQEQRYRENLFQVKKTLKEFQNLSFGRTIPEPKKNILDGTGYVVVTAVVINAANFTLKLLAWLYTGSHSLFSEAIHSLADTCNQLILAFGIHKSIQKADQDHPYGYTTMRYVASLVSGVGIFCFGTGLSMYHGIMGLLYPTPPGSYYWAFFILGGALVSEGGTLLVAINALRKGAKENGMSFKEYVLRSQDPSVNVVLLEDIAAVLGVGIAATCMGLSTYLQSPVPDAIGSCIIGVLLGIVASFIIQTNGAALVGRSIPFARLGAINRELENDFMIRAIHDAKCIDMGNMVRYKAEIDFDGRELTRSYLDKQDLEVLLEEMQGLKTIDEVEVFMLKHGENVIDMVGAEIDRIESQLKKRHPEIRHCDLEML